MGVRILLLLPILLSCAQLRAQDPIRDFRYQFLAYGKVHTWTGVAEVAPDQYEIHLYDPAVYRGHAEFVSRGLKTGLTFREFKTRVQSPQTREYLPFFLYDLRNSPVEVKGRTCHWALRIEDYELQDSDAEIVAAASELMAQVGQYFGKSAGPSYKTGALILAGAQKVVPQRRHAAAFLDRGIPTLSLQQMLKAVGGRRVTVLNPGTAVGKLRRVPAGQETDFPYHRDDILMYEEIPHRVPPVAGIITLQPQTELSHINLLALNRGTVNLYALSLADLPGAEDLLDQLVRVEAGANKVQILPATENEWARFKARQAPSKVQIPEVNLRIGGIVKLATGDPVGLQTVAIGAKAANYSRLQSWHPDFVRPGYALPFIHYFKVLEASGAQPLIAWLLAKKDQLQTGEIHGCLQEIRDSIRASQVDPALIADIRDLINREFPGSRIRLRSSTNCEDLPDFNGAGLYLSKGFNAKDPDKKLRKKLLKVFASLWSDLAFEEREYYQLDHTKVGMAVLINEAFRDEYANGVVLTLPQASGYTIRINAQTGEHAVTNPESGEVPESIELQPDDPGPPTFSQRSNLGDVFFENAPLTPLLRDLQRLSQDIHTRMTTGKQQTGKRFGIDIEFKIMREARGYKLYLKQCRLLGTVLPQ